MDEILDRVEAPLILIVDDDRSTRLLLDRVLRRDGYLIEEAENGSQALEAFERLQPDIILLDAMMPEMDGFTACTRLRALPGGGRVPVLMITARSDNASVDQAFEVGATDYIIKPIHYGVVRQRVRRLLEAKRTGEALRQSEQLYRAVVEEQTELLCRWRPDGKLTFVNEAFCRHFGGSRDELFDADFHSVFSATDREAVKVHINEMTSPLSLTNPTITKEFPIKGRSGKVYWIQWTNRAIFDDDENLVEYQTVGRDITERKQAEEALREKTAELQAVFKVIPDLFFRLEPNGLILNAYAGSASDFYLPPKEFIGKNVTEVLPPESASILQDAVAKVHRTNTPQTKEYVLPLEQEEQVYEARLWPFQETEVIALVRNITERKQMEARILNSQKLADLGTLAAGAAHEINSPLQVITGLSQSLLHRMDREMLEPDYLRRKLDIIQRNGWRCAEIVRSLRTYAHVSATQVEPNDLNLLVQDTLLLIEHQLKSWSNISVTTELAPELPLLPCDRNQITQILINLLTNARDAMREMGEIIVRTGYDPKISCLILQVSDTGPGIPESVRSKIFDPFFTTKSLGQGTGLGLSIVAGIVRAYNGEIKIDSVSGQGTTFTLLFPEKGISIPLPASPDGKGRFDDTVYPISVPNGTNRSDAEVIY